VAPALQKRCGVRSASGFSLLEVIVALAILAVAIWSIAQVGLYTARSADVARRLTMGSELAADKLGQLSSLSWSLDEAGLPVSDTATDLTTDPESPAGGPGLRTSPPDALERNAPGYCEFLDRDGRSLGGGTSPPEGTAFVRRWSLTPLGAFPADGLAVQVRLMSAEVALRGGTDPAAVTLTTVRARLAP
jgi:prepilin-type N-terminal cleavage/methylation domain-containing protein